MKSCFFLKKVDCIDNFFTFFRLTAAVGLDQLLSSGAALLEIDTVPPTAPDVLADDLIIYLRAPWGTDATGGLETQLQAWVARAGAGLVLWPNVK